MEALFKVSLLVLLCALTGAVIYEGQQAHDDARFAQVSLPAIQEVSVVNWPKDPIPVVVSEPVEVTGGTYKTAQGITLGLPVRVEVQR